MNKFKCGKLKKSNSKCHQHLSSIVTWKASFTVSLFDKSSEVFDRRGAELENEYKEAEIVGSVWETF